MSTDTFRRIRPGDYAALFRQYNAKPGIGIKDEVIDGHRVMSMAFASSREDNPGTHVGHILTYDVGYLFGFKFGVAAANGVKYLAKYKQLWEAAKLHAFADPDLATKAKIGYADGLACGRLHPAIISWKGVWDGVGKQHFPAS